jgi:hypothetical protein
MMKIEEKRTSKRQKGRCGGNREGGERGNKGTFFGLLFLFLAGFLCTILSDMF